MQGVQCRLEQLEARGLELRIGGAKATVHHVEGLRGDLVAGDGHLEINHASARRAVVQLALELPAGTVTAEAVAIEEVRGKLRRTPDEQTCELEAPVVGAARLVIVVGEVTISGAITVTRCRLRIDGEDGMVLAEGVELADVELRRGDLVLAMPRLAGVQVVAAWGTDGLRIEAGSIAIAEIGGSAPLTATPSAPGASPPESTEMMALLDGLAGEVNVDLALDLTVPVIGRRRATHRFRIPIADGAVDYMGLEKDLSTLESALLDFAIRDGALVLEMGIPFLPTRGLGKPILQWDLAPADLDLARRDRIRLALLPRFRTVGGESGSSRIALRQLEVRDLDVKLSHSLASPPPRWPLLGIGSLTLSGSLYHEADAPPRDGRLVGGLAELVVGEMSIGVANNTIGFTRLQLARADRFELGFVGARACSLACTLHDLVVEGFRFAPARPPTRESNLDA